MALTTDNIKYANSAALTITLNSLATSSTVGRQATVVDNSSNLYDDALITVIISTSASAMGNTKSVYVFVSGSEDGTNYDQDDGVMGASDAAYTVGTPTNLKLAKVIACPTSSKVYNGVFSLAAMFGGVMPRKWTIVVVNDTNQSLLGSGNSASYSGITYTNQ